MKSVKPIVLKNGLCTCKKPEEDCPLKTKSQYRCTKGELDEEGITTITSERNETLKK